MVKRAIAVARRAGIRDVRLYPSFTQDPKRNPLAHREKVKWLRKFFKGVKVIDDKDARTPFAAARQLSDEGVKRVIMIAGGDRIKEFQSQISKYIKHKDPDKSFEFDEFQVVSAGERDPDAVLEGDLQAGKRLPRRCLSGAVRLPHSAVEVTEALGLLAGLVETGSEVQRPRQIREDPEAL